MISLSNIFMPLKYSTFKGAEDGNIILSILQWFNEGGNILLGGGACFNVVIFCTIVFNAFQLRSIKITQVVELVSKELRTSHGWYS